MSAQEEMIDHALESYPNECCGLLVGNGDRIEIVQLANIEASPYAFQMDPKELVASYARMEDLGWELLAIYHSHPYGEAYPSATDLLIAAWPMCVVIGLEDTRSPEIRVFRIEDLAITEETGWLW